MNFKEFKSKLLLEIDEIVINKKVTIQGQELLFLSFIKGQTENTLFALYNGNKEINEDNEQYLSGNDEIEEYVLTTNREDMINSIESSNQSANIFLKEMTIQNQVVTFESSSTGSIEYYDADDILILKHYIENQMIPHEFDHVHLENIILIRFKQNSEEDFPKISTNEEIIVTLEADERSREILIQQPFKSSIGIFEKNNKINYINSENNEKEYFYLDELSKYDLWDDIHRNLNDTLENIEESQREEFKNEYISCSEEQCPRGMDLLTVYYETIDNSHLNIFTKKYLESEVANSSSGLIMCSKSNEQGINGNTTSIDYLGPVEKDFNDIVEMEVFSKVINIPSERITIYLSTAPGCIIPI